MSEEYERVVKQARSIIEQSMSLFSDITHDSTEHLRRTADEFERIGKDADRQIRGILDVWGKQQIDIGKGKT